MSCYYPAAARYPTQGQYVQYPAPTTTVVQQQPPMQQMVQQPRLLSSASVQPILMAPTVVPVAPQPAVQSLPPAAAGLPKGASIKYVSADENNPSYANGRLLEQGAASVRRQQSRDNLPGSPTHHDPDVLLYPEDPISAVELLRAGNERFTRGQVLAPHRNMERVKNLAGGQHPFAAFLSCADSRVPVEILFDQGFGDIFVVRVAGNVSNPEVVGSLEFGTSVLGAKVLYVLGHTACGAVKAAGTCEGEDVPGLVSSLFYHVKPALRNVNGDVDAAVGENVKLQAQQLAEVSPIIRTLIRQKKLIVVGGVYDLESGQVKEVCQITEVPSTAQK